MAQATAALWVLSLFLMASSLARALGVTLWVDLLLGVILVAVQEPLVAQASRPQSAVRRPHHNSWSFGRTRCGEQCTE